MRKSYARRLIRLLEWETILLFAVLILIGRGWLVFPDLTVQLFLAFSIGQIVSMMLIIVKFLFSKDSHVILRDIASILQEVSRWDRQQEG